MMQAAFNPDSQVQSSVDLPSMNYKDLIAHGAPFCEAKRINVNDPTDLRVAVETIVVKNGTPIILEGWHKHKDWNHELFTFPFIQNNFGEDIILCRDLRNAADVKMSMNDYIRSVHTDSLSSDDSHPHNSPDTDIAVTPNLTAASSSRASTSMDDSGEEHNIEKSTTSEMQVDTEIATIITATHSTATSTSTTTTTVIATEDGTSMDCKEESSSNEVTAQDAAPVDAITGNAPVSEETRLRSRRGRAPLYYAKDVTCPALWRSHLEDVLPEWLSYMKNNDLLTNVASSLAAENLMIYIGTAGTWTPAHIDQCGAIGHNIMAWADDDSSSIWFMVESKHKEKAEALWASFGRPLEYEGYFAAVEQLKQADFPIYVVEQKIGDFVMVPSMCYHQVVNLGKATIKVSWNRLTSNCLNAALKTVLPKYQEICRPEGYRIKLIVKSTLEAWKNLLQEQSTDLPLPQKSFCESFLKILALFKKIVEEDWVDLNALGLANAEFIKPRRMHQAGPASCDFCSADLWNRLFHCSKCLQDGDTYDCCTRCFSRGRGCEHRGTSMEFVESFSLKSCRELYSAAIKSWNESVCLAGTDGHAAIEDDWIRGIVPTPEKDYSFTTMAYKRRMELAMPQKSCHDCRRRTVSRTSLKCSNCPAYYCETCLWRFYDTLWSEAGAKKEGWECPRCKGKCECRACSAGHTSQVLPVRPKALWFNRPDDEPRNRGGVMDDMNRNFVEEAPTEENEDNDDMSVLLLQDLQEMQTMSMQSPSPQQHQALKRTATSSGSSSGIKKQKNSHSDIAKTDSFWKTEPFEAFVGNKNENTLRLFSSLGFSRTLQALQQVEKAEQLYYSELFQADRLLSQQGEVRSDIQDIFRREALEKQVLKRRQ